MKVIFGHVCVKSNPNQQPHATYSELARDAYKRCGWTSNHTIYYISIGDPIVSSTDIEEHQLISTRHHLNHRIPTIWLSFLATKWESNNFKAIQYA